MCSYPFQIPWNRYIARSNARPHIHPPTTPMRNLTLVLVAGLLLAACADAPQQDAPQPAEDPAQTMAQQKADEARARLEASEGGRLVLRTI